MPGLQRGLPLLERVSLGLSAPFSCNDTLKKPCLTPMIIRCTPALDTQGTSWIREDGRLPAAQGPDKHLETLETDLSLLRNAEPSKKQALAIRAVKKPL